nr:glycosyltransferase family 25 protein [uncultured Roseovarius sp.]
MAMRAYVLHLLRAEKRRQNARDLLRNCGVAGTIWPAVDGAAMSSGDLAKSYGADLFEPPYPFALRTGEIGCFLSHRQIWADMQDHSEDAALIIEDDAGLDAPLFEQAMALANEHVQALGYIQLQTRPPRSPSRLIDKNGPCALVLPEMAGLRTTAQVVSKQAAARLLARSDPFDRPVDTYVQSSWYTGLHPAMITPSGVLEIADQLDGSTIQSSKKSLWERATREVKRSRYRAAVRRISRQALPPEPSDD